MLVVHLKQKLPRCVTCDQCSLTSSVGGACICILLQDYAGIVEKGELADRVKQAAAQGPQGQEAAVPAGYVLDPSSGAHAFINAHPVRHT